MGGRDSWPPRAEREEKVCMVGGGMVQRKRGADPKAEVRLRAVHGV